MASAEYEYQCLCAEGYEGKSLNQLVFVFVFNIGIDIDYGST